MILFEKSASLLLFHNLFNEFYSLSISSIVWSVGFSFSDSIELCKYEDANLSWEYAVENFSKCPILDHDVPGFSAILRMLELNLWTASMFYVEGWPECLKSLIDPVYLNFLNNFFTVDEEITILIILIFCIKIANCNCQTLFLKIA